jgi:hypothetical protein
LCWAIRAEESSYPHIFKFSSKTTGKTYSFVASSEFVKNVPKSNSLEESEIEKISLAYATKYLGSKRVDMITTLESSPVECASAKAIFLTFSVLDKNRQMILPEHSILIFGDGSYLALLQR